MNSKIREPTDALSIEEDHFDRLSTAAYYDESKFDAIYEFMSMLSQNSEGQPLEEVFTLLNQKLDRDSNEKLSQAQFNDLVQSLAADHLVERDGANIRFKYEIVRRSWNFHKAGGA